MLKELFQTPMLAKSNSKIVYCFASTTFFNTIGETMLFHAPDFGTQLLQAGINVLVAPVNLVAVLDHAAAFGA